MVQKCIMGSSGGVSLKDTSIPNMTSDTSPDGYIASRDFTPYAGASAYVCFDGDVSTLMYGPASGTYCYVDIETPSPIKVEEFDYFCTNSGSAIVLFGFIKNNDSTSLVEIYRGAPTLGSLQTLSISADAFFSKFRILIEGGSSSATPAIIEANVKGKTYA